MPRFFFALWPEQTVREQIVNCRSVCAPNGKFIPQKNLHITLLFMGNLTLNQVQNVIIEALKIKLPAFDIQLNKTGHFRKVKVSWMGLKAIPDTLLKLHQALSKCADISQISLQHRSYIPHLTLARKVSIVKKQVFTPINWKINHFVLIESTDTPHGVHYQIIKIFPLQTGKKHDNPKLIS